MLVELVDNDLTSFYIKFSGICQAYVVGDEPSKVGHTTANNEPMASWL